MVGGGGFPCRPALGLLENDPSPGKWLSLLQPAQAILQSVDLQLPFLLLAELCDEWLNAD